MKHAFKNLVALLILVSVVGNLLAVDAAVAVANPTRINDADVLAEYDGGVITRSDIMQKIEALQPQVQGRYKTTEGQLQVLDITVAENLFYKKALELGIDQNPQVLQRIQAAEKQFFVQEYYRRMISEMTEVTEEMKREYYNNNMLLYYTLPYVTIDYIQAADEAKAIQALAMLGLGSSFAEVSDSLNLNTYAKGLQGRIRNIRLNGNIPGVGNDPALEELIRNTEVSETNFVGPNQTTTGWSIFRVVELIPGVQRTYEQVYDELEQRVRPTAERANLDRITAGLKTKYAVEIDSTNLARVNFRAPDETIPFQDSLVVRSNNEDLQLTIGDLLTAYTMVSPQEQMFFARGGAAGFVDQEMIRNLLYTEAKALNFRQYLEQDPQFIQMKRYHILSNAFRILVRETTEVTTEDAMAYYNDNIDSYSTPASRDIQVLWFNDMDVANRTWSLFNLANRIRNENRMTELITRYSTQPDRNELPNQYNNGTVTGVGPDAEFSRLIWSTEVNAISPVFTTATGEIVFFRVLREKPVSATPFVEVEPRIQGAIRQTKERAKQDEVIQQLSTEYHLRKYPERITLLLSADDLFELANSAAQQRNYTDSITYYDQIISNYRNNVDDYKASFMKAFLISEEMNNKPRALELFRQFITGFPEGDLHESAQFMIDVLEGNVDPLPIIEE